MSRSLPLLEAIWAAGSFGDRKGGGKVFSNDPGGERQLKAVPLEESKSTQKTESCSVVSESLQPHGLYSLWNSPGQNTGVGSCSLLQGIFPTQGSNSGLPHSRGILYQLSHKGSPKILEWVAYPFSRESSRTRNQTRVSCIAGGFFTN